MDFRYRPSAAAFMAAILLFASTINADSGGGGSTAEDTGSNDMTYLTIGLAVLVGGFLIYDAITDSGTDDATVPDTASPGIMDTGVDWDTVISADPVGGPVIAAVSVFPGPEGLQRSMQLIGAMKEIAGENLRIYEDPVDFGSGPLVQRAALAGEFFGAGYLIFQAESADSILTFGVASPDSILWTSSDQSGNSMLIVANEIIQAGIF